MSSLITTLKLCRLKLKQQIYSNPLNKNDHVHTRHLPLMRNVHVIWANNALTLMPGTAPRIKKEHSYTYTSLPGPSWAVLGRTSILLNLQRYVTPLKWFLEACIQQRALRNLKTPCVTTLIPNEWPLLATPTPTLKFGYVTHVKAMLIYNLQHAIGMGMPMWWRHIAEVQIVTSLAARQPIRTTDHLLLILYTVLLQQISSAYVWGTSQTTAARINITRITSPALS
jgi:hypothetical protein